jgi:hypothetical protein
MDKSLLRKEPIVEILAALKRTHKKLKKKKHSKLTGIWRSTNLMTWVSRKKFSVVSTLTVTKNQLPSKKKESFP